VMTSIVAYKEPVAWACCECTSSTQLVMHGAVLQCLFLSMPMHVEFGVDNEAFAPGATLMTVRYLWLA